MSQEAMRDLCETMLVQATAHMKKTRPVMKLTENGYESTGEEEHIWEAKDITAFSGLLKLCDYKHVDGISASPAALRDDLARKRAMRDKRRQEGNTHLDIVIPDIGVM